MNWGNIVFSGQEFKAIDYGDAEPGEPYLDVATVAADCLSCPGHEKVLLSAYLGHEPSAMEKAKLYLLEQVVVVKWVCDRLRNLSSKDFLQYDLVEAPSSEDFFKRDYDLSKPEDCLKFFKGSFKRVLEQATTKAFQDSLDLLNGGVMEKSMVRYVHHNGLDFWCEAIGDPTRPAILLVSGAGAHAHFWTNSFCDTLVRGGYFVIRFDHRDTGLSSAVDFVKEPYSVVDLCEDVIAILNAWNIKKAHIVGHSMGGTIAQLLAISHPDRLLSLTSISVSVLGTPVVTSEEVMDSLLENKPTQDFEESLGGFMRSWSILNGELPLDTEMAKEYTKELYTRSSHPVGVAWNHIRCQERLPDFSTQLSKVAVPMLFVHGGADPLIPAETALKGTHIIPNVCVEILPQMGHMMFHSGLQQQVANLILKHAQKTEVA